MPSSSVVCVQTTLLLPHPVNSSKAPMPKTKVFFHFFHFFSTTIILKNKLNDNIFNYNDTINSKIVCKKINITTKELFNYQNNDIILLGENKC